MGILPYSPLLQVLSDSSVSKEEIALVQQFDRQLYRHVRLHLILLSIWSVLGILLGFTGMLLLSGTGWYFCLMTEIWALVNAIITWFLWIHARKLGHFEDRIWLRFQIQWHVENMFWLNIGLDLMYLASGLIFIFAATQHEEIFAGFGYAILVQGFFLFLIDLITRFRIRQNYHKISYMLKRQMRA